jgi:ribonuclease E
MAASPAPSAPSEPPRRRSTVREPAPVFGDGAPTAIPAAPPPAEPAPIVTSAAGDDADKPRRTGWWAKRILGDKS